LAATVGSEHVLGGLCGLISYVVEPGHICHAGADPFVKFGELDNRPSERAEKLRKAFDRTIGVTAQIPSDIQAALWQKFMFVTAWSGLGAVTRSPVGIFRSLPETRRLLIQIMKEIYNVAQARNINLPKDVIDTTVKFFDGLPPEGTASMQRDIINGLPSELDFQNGSVVRLGQEVGVDTPVNSFIYNSLLPMEKRARGQIQFDV
jgi:2-dehydropantoate 2-reductase